VLLLVVRRSPMGPIRNELDHQFWKRVGSHTFPMDVSMIALEMTRRDTDRTEFLKGKHDWLTIGTPPMSKLYFTSGLIEEREKLFNVEDLKVPMKVEPFECYEARGEYLPDGIRFDQDWGGLDIFEKHYLQLTDRSHAAFTLTSGGSPRTTYEYSDPKVFARLLFFVAMKSIHIFGPGSPYILFCSW